MRLKTYIRMKSCPSVSLNADISPIDIKTALSGGLHAEAGPFSGKVGEIPIRMSIPFLKRRPVVASIDGFPLCLDRFHISVGEATLKVDGTLGQNGIQAKIESKIDCETDMDIKGTVAGRVGLSHLDFVDDEDHPKQEVAEREE